MYVIVGILRLEVGAKKKIPGAWGFPPGCSRLGIRGTTVENSTQNALTTSHLDRTVKEE